MITDTFAVHPDMGAVIRRADMEKRSSAGFWLIVKVPLVPDDAFKPEERRLLGVPIARNLQGRGGGKVILLDTPSMHIGMVILRVAGVPDFTLPVVERSSGLVDQVMPVPIQACHRTAVDAYQQSVERHLRAEHAGDAKDE